MASIARRPDGQWRARYRDAAGKEHARHFARKVDAQRWLDEVNASVLTGAYVDPKAGRITLRDYATTWQASHVGRDHTASNIDVALRRHILPALGERPVATLRRSDVQGLVKALSATLKPSTVKLVYGVLSRVLTAAVEDRVLPVSPCRRIILPAIPRGEIEPATAEQVHELADAMPARYRAAVVLLAGSGLRIGEALGLRVSDVDFLRRTVKVERQRYRTGAVGPTKTAASVRTVPLGRVVIDELAAHLAAYPPGEWMFTQSDGAPLDYYGWQQAWRTVQRATGLDVNTHGLRHFAASALIAGGASVKQVQTVLGHSSAATTLQVYSHLWPGDDDRTRSVMDAALDVLRTGRGPGAPADGITAGQTAAEAMDRTHRCSAWSA